MKVVFICSTNGSVIKKALGSQLLARNEIEFVSDRYCGAIMYAEALGYKIHVYETPSGREFSAFLNERYELNEDILFISFYTKFLTEPFLKGNSRKIINFHPSILPACPGMKGFEDTIESKAMLIGSTVHFVDSGIDTGKPILQTLFPKEFQSIDKLRHRVYLQQSISLLQIIKWFSEKKVKIKEGNVYIDDGVYSLNEFLPNLDIEYKKLFDEWL